MYEEQAYGMDTAREPTGSVPIPTEDFTDRDRADVALQGMIANAKEKKDRVDQAKTEIQYPAIERSLELSRNRADGLLSELRTTREYLSTPPPQLVQGQLQDTDLYATALGMLFNPNAAGQMLGDVTASRDKQNAVKYQNETNAFNLNREQSLQLVDYLQKQLGMEQNLQSDLSLTDLKLGIDEQQRLQSQTFQAGEADKSRGFTEKQSSWSQFYGANNEGEIMAAARRLQELDKSHAPKQTEIDAALKSAGLRRQKEALNFYNMTVQKLIDSYQGVVPDDVAKDLEKRIQAIATEFQVPATIFGEIPSAAFWKRQYDVKNLQQRHDEWSEKLKFMEKKEANDVIRDLAAISATKERIAIAKQNANTAVARLEFQKLKDLTKDTTNKLDSKRQTLVLDLRAKEAQVRSYRGDKKMLPFDRDRKIAETTAALAGIQAKIKTIDELRNGLSQEVKAIGTDPIITQWRSGDPTPPGYDLVPDPATHGTSATIVKKKPASPKTQKKGELTPEQKALRDKYGINR